MGKVVIVGLDGATFDVIRPMFEQGRMKNFKELADKGSSGTLTSTILPLSATAWTSFATGVNPGKHSIYDFSRRVKSSYQHVPTTSVDRGARSVWRYASDAHKKCCIVNVPLTYPPERVNGIMISGFPYPETKRDFAYPREVLADIKNDLGITHLHKPSPHFLRAGDERKLVDQLFEITSKQTEVVKYLLRRESWDLFVTVFDATDVISHFFWRYIDPKNPKYDEKKAREFGPLFYDVYESVDRAYGDIRRSLSEAEDNIFVISDHGFGPVYYAVYMNNWLIKNNYLKLKRSLGTRLRRQFFRIGITTDFLFRTAKKLRLVGTGTFAYSTKSLSLQMAKKFSLTLDDVDWKETEVYSYGNYGQFFLNVRGREPDGRVESGNQYRRLVSELIMKLQQLKDPKTGRQLFDLIFTKDQIYFGPFVELAPDIVFFDSTMTYRAHRLFEFGSRNMIAPDPIYSGSHRMDGILIAGGPDVAHREGVRAKLIDIAPTISHLLGLPVSTEMDGRVMLDILAPESRFLRSEVRYTPGAISDDIRGAARKLLALGKKV